MKNILKVRKLRLISLILIFAVVASIFTIVYAYRIPEVVTKEGIRFKYGHRVTYDYNVTLAPNILYNNRTSLENPNTTFLKLLRDVNISYNYEFYSTAPSKVSGNLTATVIVGQTPLWKKALDYKVIKFSGSTATFSTYLNISKILNFTKTISDEIGIQASKYYVKLVMEPKVKASIKGEAVTESYPTSFTIDLDLTSGLALFSQREFHSETPVTYKEVSENYVYLGFATLTVSQFRLISAIPLIASLILLGSTIIANRDRILGTTSAESERISKRYRSILVNVSEAPSEESMTVIDVKQFKDLVKVAESLAKPIIHFSTSGQSTKHIYFVTDGDVLYRYSIDEE
ncbi:MAG: hypothetical protein J7L51_01150 [Desulfurococcales archaeon]|nr:hypothetical protein [Desulfurococcales archaeon]